MEPETTKPKTSEIGDLLPGVDPAIAESIYQMLQANPEAHPAELVVAAVTGAPAPEVAVEMVSAMLELLVCRERGHLVWIETRSHMILTGIRHSSDKAAIEFGHARWPHAALSVGPPKSVRINTPGGHRRVWLACESLRGSIIRQSEAIALGNAMIEEFGGRIVEDRSGPDVLRHAVMEDHQTAKARARSEARGAIERLHLAKPEPKKRYRVPLAEAVPGTLLPGMVLHPQGEPGNRYEVESRVNESWVILVGIGSVSPASPAAWVPAMAMDLGGLDHAGFTDEIAR